MAKVKHEIIAKFQTEREFNYVCMALDIINFAHRRAGIDPATLTEVATLATLGWAAQQIKRAKKDNLMNAVIEEKTELAHEKEKDAKSVRNTDKNNSPIIETVQPEGHLNPKG